MITKSQIESLISKPMRNNLSSHYKTMLFRDETKYSGEIGNREVFLWRSAKFLRGTYPVFVFTFDSNSNLIDLKIVKNEYDVFSNKASIVIGFVFAVLFFLFSENLLQFVLYLGWMILISAALYFLFKSSTKHEVNLLKAELKSELIMLDSNPQNASKENGFITVEKEKSNVVKDLILRILLYPFSFFVIVFSLYNITESLIFIFGVIFPSIYLASDLLYLFGKREINSKFFDFLDD